MNAGVERARQVAEQAHAGQTKKVNGEPFIEHVRRVVTGVPSDEEKTVAWLHDVVEKATDWSLQRLRQEGFSEQVVAAVDAMTKRGGETRENFTRRAASNVLARSVKRADLSDNLAAAERSGNDGSKYREGLRIIAEEFD